MIREPFRNKDWVYLMASENASQVLCGPFASDDFPDFQAACVHFDQQWSRLLSQTEAEFLKAVIYRTCRMGIRYRKRRIPMAWFFDGHLGNEITGYAGCPSMLPVSRKTFHKVRNDLVSYGILRYEGESYAIDYSVTALHLIEHENIQKRTLAANRHGGILSTMEGLDKWARHCVSLLIQQSTANRDQDPIAACPAPKSYGSSTSQRKKQETAYASKMDVQCPKNTSTHGEKNCSNVIQISSFSRKTHRTETGETQSVMLPYRVTHNTYVISSDKSSDISCGDGELDNEELKARLMQQVQGKRDAVEKKRRTRGNLSDMCSLFEAAWRKGQHERDSKVLASRLVTRDRALLKSQIVGPARDLGIDMEEFAYWTAVNWDAIGGQYFRKAKSYPAAPSFPWLVRCLETYTRAFAARDDLDPTAQRKDAQRVTAQAVAVIQNVAASELDDLKAQLREARSDNTKLREQFGLSVDDDPVYARAVKLASKKVTIGRYDDDEPKPARKKLKRHRK